MKDELQKIIYDWHKQRDKLYAAYMDLENMALKLGYKIDRMTGKLIKK